MALHFDSRDGLSNKATPIEHVPVVPYIIGVKDTEDSRTRWHGGYALLDRRGRVD